MISQTEMNSFASIVLAYISDFCRRINKFTCKSIMHEFVFIISTRESPRLWAFNPVQHRDAGSSFRSDVCLFSTKLMLFIQPTPAGENDLLRSSEWDLDLKVKCMFPLTMSYFYGKALIMSRTFITILFFSSIYYFFASFASWTKVLLR